MPHPSPASPILAEIAAAKSTISGANEINATTTDTTSNSGVRKSSVIIPKKSAIGDPQSANTLRSRHVLLPNKDKDLNLAEQAVPDKYTRKGRLILGNKESSGDLLKKGTASPGNETIANKTDSLFKSPTIQRIRTRLGLRPELYKQPQETENIAKGKKTGAATKTLARHPSGINNCNGLKKQEILNLARQGMLPADYIELAKQCLIAHNSGYNRVNKFIAVYSQQRGLLNQIVERARPYLYHIVDALSKHRLPMDLALLPIVESAYQATALSNKQAAGLWQFIPSTGLEYGLVQNVSYDGRLDATAATNAAIRFLSGLNGHFKGDWLLSLAAYNSGQGTVDAAIARNQAEGLDTDFWSLDLPAETEDYVPRLLALTRIFASPGSYGIRLRPISNEPYFIKVNVDRDIDIALLHNKDLKTIAKLADYDQGQFELLNTAYLKSVIYEKKPFSLLMPISNANQLYQSLAFLSQADKKQEKSDGLLPDLAFGLSSNLYQYPLLAINLVENQTRQPPKNLAAKSEDTSTSKEREIENIDGIDNTLLSVHYLDKGESIKSLADYHSISEEKLRVLNKFTRRQSLSLGQRLFIPLKQWADKTLKKNHPSILFGVLK